MKARCCESISTRSIEQLELLAAQLAQLDEVLLQIVGAEYRRVDRRTVGFAGKMTTYASNCVTRARHELNGLIADDFLFELLAKWFDLLQQCFAFRLDLFPLRIVAVQCLE